MEERETITTPQTENLGIDTRTFEEKVKDAGTKIMSIAPLLCGIAIGIWWIFYGMVEIYPTNLGIKERIGLTLATVFLAVTYCKLIAVGGFESARKTKSYTKLASDWNDAITKGNRHKKEIIEYAKTIARSNLKEVRTENLEKNGLYYYDIFNDDGELIKQDYLTDKYHKTKNPNGLYKKQIKIITKCINIRIQIPEMFGNISSRFFGIKKRVSQKQFETKTDIKNTIVRIVISAVTVGVMFRWIGISAGALVYAFFQIVLWTASGILQRLKNYNFVIRELQPQILENTLIINGYLELNEEEKEKYKSIVFENEQARKRLQIEMKRS